MAALQRLGRLAWEAKIDLSAFADLRDQLGQVDRRSSELTSALKKLGERKAALEAQRQAETAKFDAQRKAVEEKKRPVDAALRTAQTHQAEQERTIRRLEARQAKLGADLAALDQKLAAPAGTAAPEQAAQLSADQAKCQQLLAEQQRVSAELTSARQSLPPFVAEVSRLAAEGQGYAQEIAKIEADRNTVLAPITAELSRVLRDWNAATQQAAAVEREQGLRFTQLGQVLYERQSPEPALADGMAQLAAIDRTLTAQRAALEASLAMTRSMPSGTMLKFYSTVLLLPLLLIGAGYGGYTAWVRWHESRIEKEFAVPPREINPYLSHPLRDQPAYVLADRLLAARTVDEVASRMLDAFRAIHLGVYTYDGTQVLAGSEQSDKDFYLYDFEWRTLARSFQRRQFMDFDDHSRMLAVGLLRMENPDLLALVLRAAIYQRYQAAVLKPDHPKSFLILLVDGLARHKPKPYSLAEIESRLGKDLDLDSLQSFLIMLDFFTKPPKPAGPTVGSLVRFPWDWLPSVRADAPCENISGDKSEGGWGTESSEVVEKITKIGGMASGVLGSATGVGDLLELWGLEIRVRADPPTVHLRHAGPKPIIKFDAEVTYGTEGAPNQPVKCGRRAGQNMPGGPKPVKDMELTWNVEPEWPPFLPVPESFSDRLARKGSGGTMGLKTYTDENGHSSFELEAADCPYQTGMVVTRLYQMTATARFASRKIPTSALTLEGPLATISIIGKLPPGAIEYLINGRTGRSDFFVSWHMKHPKPPQYGQ
jgi:hypothetical protein